MVKEDQTLSKYSKLIEDLNIQKEKVILDITVQINLRVDDEIKKIAKNIKE